MLNGPIPPQVDPRKLADRSATLEGVVSIASFERLSEALADTAGDVSAKLVFGRDERRAAFLHSTLQAEVKMICQRCLETVSLPIRSECHYAIVKPDADLQSLPKGYDVLEAGEEPLDLLSLIEEEMLLALPIVPAHDPADCQQPVGVTEPEPCEDEVSRSNPFSVLAQLKRDPNV